MNTYRIIYDTDTEVNKVFVVEAGDPQSAWDVFFWEVETEETVERSTMVEE